jgi:uncharacterized membrane protein
MPLLTIAVIVWIGIHLGLAGTRLRNVIVRRTGEVAFRIVFSLLSVLGLLFLVKAWEAAPTLLLWAPPDWLRWLLVAAMLPAFVLFAGSVSVRNPTAIGPRDQAAEPPRGIIRVTRHPMLWSFSIWACVHLVGNGDTASLVFFGAFLATSLAGMPSIDAKLARRDPNTWAALSAATSIVPFGAIAGQRNRLVLREIGWLTPAIGGLAWIATLLLHPWVFGVAPVTL